MILNKFSLISLLLLCSTLFISAQVDQKYLAGAVPLVDGKVQFTREIKVTSEVSNKQLLGLVEAWATEEFPEVEDSKQRILLVNEEDSYIAILGDEKLVFKSQFLMLDQAIMTYHLVIKTERGKCKLEVRNIKYEYQDYDKIVTAEEMITDEMVINKNGDKLNRHYDKFRTFTIDRVDELRNSLLEHLGQVSLEEIKPKAPASIIDIEKSPTPTPSIKVEGSPAVSVAQPMAVGETAMAGYKQMSADEITENIMSMFKDNWALVIAGKDDKPTVMTAAWSGMGSFGGKPVSMSIVNSKNNSEEVYTISFYTQIHKDALTKLEKGKDSEKIKSSKLTPITTPSGATAFAEAWMIIECKKVLEQPVTSSMIDNAQSKEWSSKDFDKLFMGEIVNVWAR